MSFYFYYLSNCIYKNKKQIFLILNFSFYFFLKLNCAFFIYMQFVYDAHPGPHNEMWSNKLENPNSSWLSLRGTWLTNVLIAMVLKVAFSILPGVSAEISWTLTNLTYNIVNNVLNSIIPYNFISISMYFMFFFRFCFRFCYY